MCDKNAALNIKNRAVGHSVLKGAIRSAEILYGGMAGFSRVTQKVEYALSSSADDNLISMQGKKGNVLGADYIFERKMY